VAAAVLYCSVSGPGAATVELARSLDAVR